MSKKTYLRLGACSVLVFAFWLLWMPTDVSAASGGPQAGYGEKDCPTIHRVASGENLTQIAAQYEISVEALIEENGIKDANLIVENQPLCVPAQHGSDRDGVERNRGGDEEWRSYGIPGQSYDPSLIRQEGNGPDNGYSPEENRGERQPYAEPGESYDPSVYDHQGDENSEYGYGPQHEDDDIRYLGVPGKAYDPSLQQGSRKEEYGYNHIPEDDEIDPDDSDEPVEEPEVPMEPTDPENENENEVTIP